MLAKKELAYVPIIGWMWYFLEIVFCKRKWEEDRQTVAQSLQNLRDYPENFWVGFAKHKRDIGFRTDLEMQMFLSFSGILVLALLRRNTFHSEEAPDQHAGG